MLGFLKVRALLAARRQQLQQSAQYASRSRPAQQLHCRRCLLQGYASGPGVLYSSAFRSLWFSEVGHAGSSWHAQQQPSPAATLRAQQFAASQLCRVCGQQQHVKLQRLVLQQSGVTAAAAHALCCRLCR